MYDQTQFTPLWMLEPHGFYLSADAYHGIREHSGYAPEGWITYTQNKPISFFFGAYPEESLRKEAEIGFKTFTNKNFLKKFEARREESYSISKKISEQYYAEFWGREAEILKKSPLKVLKFLREVQEVAAFIMPYYLMTQPQRFYKFEESLKPFLPNKNLELISTNGRHLTYVTQIMKVIIEVTKAIGVTGQSCDEFLDRNSKYKSLVRSTVDKLGFLNINLFGGEMANEKYISQQVDSLLADKKKFETETLKMDELVSRISQRNELCSREKNAAISLADIMGHASVLRFDFQTCLLSVLKYADTFIKQAQNQYALDTHEIGTYFTEEIFNLIEKGAIIDKEILLERQKGFLVIWKDSGAEIYAGDNARERIKNLLEFRSSEIERTKEVKGTVASLPDKAQTTIRGKAFVLTTAFDADEMVKTFQDGDILVATQTHPNLVPQMKGALAIVTDEGGITCHAAIVSRELRKPCIIGTKLATKIFKNGDIIELNLQTGKVVKI